jgi:hypothetical protein
MDWFISPENTEETLSEKIGRLMGLATHQGWLKEKLAGQDTQALSDRLQALAQNLGELSTALTEA